MNCGNIIIYILLLLQLIFGAPDWIKHISFHVAKIQQAVVSLTEAHI
jgi:hypothetical protein